MYIVEVIVVKVSKHLLFIFLATYYYYNTYVIWGAGAATWLVYMYMLYMWGRIFFVPRPQPP